MMTMIIVENHLWWPFQIWSKPLPHICIWLAQRAQIDWNDFSIEMEIRTGQRMCMKIARQTNTVQQTWKKTEQQRWQRRDREQKKRERKNRNERQNGCVVHVSFERHVLLTHAISVQQQFVVYLFHFNELTLINILDWHNFCTETIWPRESVVEAIKLIIIISHRNYEQAMKR